LAGAEDAVALELLEPVGQPAGDAGGAGRWREAFRKPVVYDELKYEGNHELRWAQLSGQEMVHRFWSCTVAGTYGGHSEFFEDDKQVVWLAQGGVLKGESPARLAFLKTILDDAPAAGLEPADQWQDPRIAGQSGRYYLIYFGKETPTSWTFELYRNALQDGMQFKAEVIDAWGMTITPVEGVFTTKKKDRYMFVDRDGRDIKLPGKPYQALRLTYVGGAAPLSMAKPPMDP
jgi:hypothetical protein